MFNLEPRKAIDFTAPAHIYTDETEALTTDGDTFTASVRAGERVPVNGFTSARVQIGVSHTLSNCGRFYEPVEGYKPKERLPADAYHKLYKHESGLPYFADGSKTPEILAWEKEQAEKKKAITDSKVKAKADAEAQYLKAVESLPITELLVLASVCSVAQGVLKSQADAIQVRCKGGGKPV